MYLPFILEDLQLWGSNQGLTKKKAVLNYQDKVWLVVITSSELARSFSELKRQWAIPSKLGTEDQTRPLFKTGSHVGWINNFYSNIYDVWVSLLTLWRNMQRELNLKKVCLGSWFQKIQVIWIHYFRLAEERWPKHQPPSGKGGCLSHSGRGAARKIKAGSRDKIHPSKSCSDDPLP